MQIQISWLLKKPSDLDLHCLQRQGISGFSRTRVKVVTTATDDILIFLLFFREHRSWYFIWTGCTKCQTLYPASKNRMLSAAVGLVLKGLQVKVLKSIENIETVTSWNMPYEQSQHTHMNYCQSWLDWVTAVCSGFQRLPRICNANSLIPYHIIEWDCKDSKQTVSVHRLIWV